MIQKFAADSRFRVVLSLICIMLLAGVATVYAQETPNQEAPTQQSQAQQSDNQQSSSQEASPEDTTRKRKPHEYRKWTFNVGGGASLTNGTTRTFVRGGGGVGAAGIARNYSRYFGLRLDFQFDNLPLRNSALELAQAPSATSHVYSLLLDPIINIPVSKNWGAYAVFGAGYYHRSGKLDSSTAVPGSACNAFFTWWGHCFNGSLPINGKFLNASQNELGENFGFGLTRKIRPNIEIYGEFRYLHGKHNNITTDLRPITVGVRW